MKTTEQIPPQEIINTILDPQKDHSKYHSYDQEMLPYVYLKEGNPLAIEESKKLFSSPPDNFSLDPLRNHKYMFVAATTLATRFAIEGGLSLESAHNINSKFISLVDKCLATSEIVLLHTEMFTSFFNTLHSQPKAQIFSKPIVQCIDYINSNLNEYLSLNVLANHIALSPSYLSYLFKKECSISLTEYIHRKRIEMAEHLLRYSNLSITEISSYLTFSTESRFIQLFKHYTGLTPKKYQNKYFRKSLD